MNPQNFAQQDSVLDLSVSLRRSPRLPPWGLSPGALLLVVTGRVPFFRNRPRSALAKPCGPKGETLRGAAVLKASGSAASQSCWRKSQKANACHSVDKGGTTCMICPRLSAAHVQVLAVRRGGGKVLSSRQYVRLIAGNESTPVLPAS